MQCPLPAPFRPIIKSVRTNKPECSADDSTSNFKTKSKSTNFLPLRLRADSAPFRPSVKMAGTKRHVNVASSLNSDKRFHGTTKTTKNKTQRKINDHGTKNKQRSLAFSAQLLNGWNETTKESQQQKVVTKQTRSKSTNFLLSRLQTHPTPFRPSVQTAGTKRRAGPRRQSQPRKKVFRTTTKNKTQRKINEQ